MSGETEQQVSGWTVDTLKDLYEALSRKDDELVAAHQRFQDERDRRYTEVAEEREKALKIKETADETARILAREIQDYKDEKANNLRDQITNERGTYLTRTEYLAQHQALIDKVDAGLLSVGDRLSTALVPLEHFMVAQQGARVGVADKTDSTAELTAVLKPLVDGVALLSGDRSRGQGRQALFDQGQVIVLAILAIGAGVLGHFIH